MGASLWHQIQVYRQHRQQRRNWTLEYQNFTTFQNGNDPIIKNWSYKCLWAWPDNNLNDLKGEYKKKLKKIWGRPSDIKSRFTGNIGNSAAGIEPLVAPHNRPSLKRQRWLRRTYRVVHLWGFFFYKAKKSSYLVIFFTKLWNQVTSLDL